MCDPLSTLERDLRRAAERRQYREIERLAELYCQAARRRLEAMPRGCPGAQRIARDAVALLEWTLLMLYAARESCRADLQRVSSLRRYRPSVRECSPSVRV